MRSRLDPKTINQTAENLNSGLQPYVFVLKEGKKINEDFLDYSLLLLQTSRPEIWKSPKKS